MTPQDFRRTISHFGIVDFFGYKAEKTKIGFVIYCPRGQHLATCQNFEKATHLLKDVWNKGEAEKLIHILKKELGVKNAEIEEARTTYSVYVNANCNFIGNVRFRISDHQPRGDFKGITGATAQECFARLKKMYKL